MTRPIQYRPHDVCKRGHIVSGENMMWVDHRSGRILRCATCETTCSNGHQKTADTWVKWGRQYRCTICAEESRVRYYATENGKAKNSARGKRRRASARLSKQQGLSKAGDVAKYDDKKTAVQRVLGIKPEAMPAHEAMSKWFEFNRSPCFEQPELYSDYDDPRYPEEQTGRPFPSTSQAEALCSECPIRTLCLEFGLKNKEDFGIYGGKRLVGGRVYQGGSGRVKKEEK